MRGAVAALVLLSTACGGISDEESSDVAPVTSDRCVAELHGKGQNGAPTVTVDGVAFVRPDGNADGWDGRQWLYFPAEVNADAVESVAAALDATGCNEVVLHGFSNGASFAASLYCDGEGFDERVVGYIVDDPVTDASVADCVGDESVPVVLYWTGGLDAESQPGTECAALDWTCEGGVIIGVDAYAAELGTEIVSSVHDEHRRYDDSPPVREFVATGRFDPMAE